jgi:hypothetical protein
MSQRNLFTGAKPAQDNPRTNVTSAPQKLNYPQRNNLRNERYSLAREVSGFKNGFSSPADPLYKVGEPLERKQ